MADEVENRLVMPFVCVQSNGGSLDDHAFVAGASYGQHDAELRAAPRAMAWSAYVIPEMVGQYDLLAMHHGFTMKASPLPTDESWWLVEFTRPTGPEEDDG